MTSGQARVLVLLIILGTLEVAVHPAVKTYFKGVYTAAGKATSAK